MYDNICYYESSQESEFSYLTLIPVICMYTIFSSLCIKILKGDSISGLFGLFGLSKLSTYEYDYTYQYKYQYNRQNEYVSNFDEITEIKNKNELVIIHQLINTMQNLKSLDRCYILYYIFKLKGTYNVNGEEYNSFKEFKLCESFYGIYNFHLDENMNPDKHVTVDITIGNITYHLYEAHYHFIAWLYYSGIYSYLIEDKAISGETEELTKEYVSKNFISIQLKHYVLSDMNRLRLLNGNLFLRYQMFLIDYESRLEANLDSILNTILDDNLEELDDIEIHLENEKEELKYKHNTDFVCNKNFLEICTEELNNLKTRILA